MEDEKKSSGLLGPLGKEWVDTRPVGGRIPRKEFEEWRKFKSGCSIAGLQLSPDGMLDMLRTYNRVNEVTFPIARAYGLKPVLFKNEVLEIILSSLSELDQKEWAKDANKFKETIRNKLNNVVKVSTQ